MQVVATTTKETIARTECSQSLFDFPACKSRKVQADFNGGTITSDAGALLLRQADRRIGLSKPLARALPDPRRQNSCEHKLPPLLRQRIYGIAARTYLNIGLVGRSPPATLCRGGGSFGKSGAFTKPLLPATQGRRGESDFEIGSSQRPNYGVTTAECRGPEFESASRTDGIAVASGPAVSSMANCAGRTLRFWRG